MSDKVFYVQAVNGQYVAAQYLQVNGNFILDPNQADAITRPIYQQNAVPNTSGNTFSAIPNGNSNGYLVVPLDYDISGATAFGQSVAQTIANTPDPEASGAGFTMGLGMMTGAYRLGGAGHGLHHNRFGERCGYRRRIGQHGQRGRRHE